MMVVVDKCLISVQNKPLKMDCFYIHQQVVQANAAMMLNPTLVASKNWHYVLENNESMSVPKVELLVFLLVILPYPARTASGEMIKVPLKKR